MPTYFVVRSELENGDHVVHADGCSSIPDADDLIDLGSYASCKEAVCQAKQLYDHCNGCIDCCRQCHAHA